MESPLDLFGLTIASMGWVSQLADLAFRSTLILSVAWLITLVLRKASAATRHRIWTIAFALTLIIPLSQAFVPHVSLPVIPSVQHYYPAVANGGEVSIIRSSGSLSAELGAMVTVAWPAVAFLVWIGGAALLFLRTVLGIGAVQWLSLGSSSTRFSHHKLDIFADLCTEFGLRRPVQLLRREKVRMPMTAGALRPMIILPEEAEEWSDSRFRSVVLHELAHVKRWDFLTKQLAALVKALCWFNPLVWIAARRMQDEMETACDDLVLGRGIKASDYALDLADLVRRCDGNMGILAGGGVAMAGSRNSLPGRLKRILDPNIDRNPLRGKSAMVLAGVLFLLTLPAFVLQPFIAPDPCRGKHHKKQYINDALAVKRMIEDAVNSLPGWSARFALQPTASQSECEKPVKANISEAKKTKSGSCTKKQKSREG